MEPHTQHWRRLVAVCLWAAQTILIRFLPEGMDLVAFQVAAFVPGLVVSLAFYVLDTAKGHSMPLSLHAALSVGYAGLIASVLGFTCWNMGVMRVGPKTAAYFGSLYPIFGATLGHLAAGILPVGRRMARSLPERWPAVCCGGKASSY